MILGFINLIFLREMEMKLKDIHSKWESNSYKESICGCLKEDLTLDARIYICDCGNILDRDLNASINLEKYGLIKLKDTDSLSEIKACGESVRLQDAFGQEAVSVNQEENMNLAKIL
jgi:transposase